jgi:hypothetical protein
MFATYLLRELRRRMRQAIFVALGLALGVGLVITVTAASDGVSAIQGTVLHWLYGGGDRRGPQHRRQLAAPRLRQPGLHGCRRRLAAAAFSQCRRCRRG